MLSRGPNEKRRKAIAAQEETMVDQLNKLTIDPQTGLPVLTNLASDIDLEEEDKTKKIEDLSSVAKTSTEKNLAKLFKSGVTTHGKISSMKRDTGEQFSGDIDEILSGFTEAKGGIEDRAIADLTQIRDAVTDTKNLYETTDTLESAFPSERYATTLTPGQKATKPLDITEDMWKYDYMTGLKDKLKA